MPAISTEIRCRPRTGILRGRLPLSAWAHLGEAGCPKEVTEDVVGILGPAEAAMAVMVPRQGAAADTGRPAVEVTDPLEAEEVTAPLHVVTEGPSEAGGHLHRRATQVPKVRMTEGLHLPGHMAPALMALADRRPVRHRLLAT
jgi:hypothetical protein